MFLTVVFNGMMAQYNFICAADHVQLSDGEIHV